jgi:Acetyltransferase (GNAT) domain
MKLYECDPIQDPRWAKSVLDSQHASVFHSVAWLRALKQTYGYEPVVFTTCSPGEPLSNGLAFCRISSWLTGRRLVSLPFSDYCDALCSSPEELSCLLESLRDIPTHKHCRYLQIRPLDSRFGETARNAGWHSTEAFHHHSIDLSPSLDEIFKGFAKDSVQRRVRHAERAGLKQRVGRAQSDLAEFYALFLKTRRRHRVPPTPFRWFQNLARELGNALEIRLAYKDEFPAAAILTLQFRNVVYYKYGCSDDQLKHYGATPWLLWKAIDAAKISGATRFDLGRTETNNSTLLAFKNHWSPSPRHLVYWQYPGLQSDGPSRRWLGQIARNVLAVLPGKSQQKIGEFLYPHIG